MARPRKAEQHRLWRHPATGIWYVAWTGSRGGERKSTGTADRGQAEQWRDQFIAGLLTPQPPSQPTVSDILTGYLADRESRVRAYQTLEYSCRPLRLILGNLEPSHISNSVVRDYAAKRHEMGRKDGTIIREIVTLRAALKWARAEDWIGEVPPIPMPVSAPPARDRWLTRDEVRRLLAATKSFHAKLFILLALKTAARRGAIMDLKWGQIDLKHARLDYGRGHGNKRRAIVPIDAQLARALKTAKKLACGDYVMEFNGQRVRSVRTAFKAACRRAGLSAVTPHVLRHTAATWAVMEGVPIGQVARLLGDSEKMVERVYGKHSPDYLKRAVASLRV